MDEFHTLSKEVLLMEHIDLINKIIEAEQRARQLADEAREKRKNMHSEIETATVDLRDSYLGRARVRIEKVKEREAAFTEERLAELDAAFEKDKESIEAAFEKSQEEWINKLFSMIVRR